MNLGQLLAVFRAEVVDETEDFFWSRTEIVEFANDAVMEAVRRGHTIIDSTTSVVCVIAYTSASAILTLDPRIILIRSAIIDGQSVPLQRAKMDWMDRSYPGWRASTAQYPDLYIDDWGSYKIRLHPKPTVAGTVNLSVAREPLVPMVVDNDTPEIPARYHRSLIYWMKYRAYSNDDEETLKTGLAAKAETKFIAEFGERRSARNEKWQEEGAFATADTLV